MMKKLLLTTFIAFWLGNGIFAQMPDKTKLDPFFDRLTEKNKAMGSLLVARNGEALFVLTPNAQQSIPLEATTENKFKVEPPGIYFEFDTKKKQMIWRRIGGERIFTREN